MTKDRFDEMDRAQLLEAVRELNTRYQDLLVSFDIVEEHNSALEEQLLLRTHDLQEDMERRNGELEAARDLNRKAHRHLLMTEKLAKLGEMVSGMTHELNTPIGVAVTASSFQVTCLERLGAALSHNAGRVLDDRLLGSIRYEIDGLDESSRMVIANLKRAADIISSFKQMSVDQVSDRPRQFGLAEVIRQTIVSLRPRFRDTPYEIELDCPDSVILDSFPGIISQVMANLILNSLVHGFEGCDSGRIRIQARLAQESGRELVVIRHEDDGRGIPAEVMPRIFDQFFTTRAGDGGSGLGLHLVRSLVVEHLGGSIDCQSRPALAGQGGWTMVELKLPLSRAG